MRALIKVIMAMALSLIFQMTALAMTIENSSAASAGNPDSETRQSGVVSKSDAGKVEINGVTYLFNPSQAKVFDLIGKENPRLEIKPGMFVNFKVDNIKGVLRVVEIRIVRP